MSTPVTEEQLKERTQKRLERLRIDAQTCLDNLDTLIQRHLSEQDRWYANELNDFYEQIRKNVDNIKKVSDSMPVPPTAQEIEKLKTAIDRALKDYKAYDAHLTKLQRASLTNSGSNKQVAREMLFDAEQGCIKVGRMLSDLAKSATHFLRSAEKLAEETRRIHEIHEAEITPEAKVRRKAAKEAQARTKEADADTDSNLISKRAKVSARKFGDFVSKTILKQPAPVEDPEALAKAAADPILDTLKTVGQKLEDKINEHNALVQQAVTNTAAQAAAELQQSQEAHEKRKQEHAPTIKAIEARLQDSKETKSDPKPPPKKKGKFGFRT